MEEKRVVAEEKKASSDNALALVGLLLGAAIGAGLGLIYSRGSGSQNRRDLNRWAHHRVDKLQQRVEGLVIKEQAPSDASDAAALQKEKDKGENNA